MALDRQINLFKIDTCAFMYEEELNLKNKVSELRHIKHELKEDGNNDYKSYNKKITNTKNKLLKTMSDNIGKRTRKLNDGVLTYKNKDGETKTNLKRVVSMFESTLSRSFGIATDELTYDIFIVEIFYYDIAKDIILNGFDYNGNHYVYFSSSAGQIRKKKAVFVNEAKYKECEKKLMCGLTIDKINSLGGMNINKFLAYLALANSATDLWEQVFNKPFDIDRCIVVDDFETMISCKVDDINYETYKITPGVNKEIPIPHTDGCGMISSDYSNKNFMVRLPFIKGLLGSFDYKKFIRETGSSSKVKDIWGKEYDIFDDDIQVIFTKSQLKMYKYYDSWDQYKEYFKEYGCEAGICNMEEDRISNAKINYQMLQTLYDATDEEITKICETANNNIRDVGKNVKKALEFFGVYLNDNRDENKDWFQKALKIYPELLNDPASKADLRDLKNSLVKRYKGGHIDVVGKFTFVLPDLYAFCEWLFGGIEVPNGLLEDQEVYCRLYKNAKKLDCLRSPHLYMEHAIRKNVCSEKPELTEWFNTDAIYTSTHDPISRILQFDVDGDRLLVLSQGTIVKMAERGSKGIYPLYYEMKKAKAETITNESLYEGLRLAFTGGNIGGISNNITKIWNSNEISQDAIDAVKWLCMETNFVIDYAKTLFKPTRPEYANEIISKYTKSKVPHFFVYAKDKSEKGVESINDSMVNRISKTITTNKMMLKNLSKMDKVNKNYLLNYEDKEYENEEINKLFDLWNKKYGQNIKVDEENTDKNNITEIVKTIKDELHKIESDDNKIFTSIVNFLYKKESTRKKKLFWYIYGKEMYENLLTNIECSTFCHICGKRHKPDELIHNTCDECLKKEEMTKKKSGKKEIECIDCGATITVDVNNKRTCRCTECQIEERKRLDRIRKSIDKNSTF